MPGGPAGCGEACCVLVRLCGSGAADQGAAWPEAGAERGWVGGAGLRAARPGSWLGLAGWGSGPSRPLCGPATPGGAGSSATRLLARPRLCGSRTAVCRPSTQTSAASAARSRLGAAQSCTARLSGAVLHSRAHSRFKRLGRLELDQCSALVRPSGRKARGPVETSVETATVVWASGCSAWRAPSSRCLPRCAPTLVEPLPDAAVKLPGPLPVSAGPLPVRKGPDGPRRALARRSCSS